jgi:glycosyltransferase involved in cell wall biosynthesis
VSNPCILDAHGLDEHQVGRCGYMMLIDATTAEQARGIAVVINQTLAALDHLPRAAGTIALTGPDSPAYENLLIARIPLARSRVPRVAFQRFLLSGYTKRLRRHGYAVDTVVLMDSYVPYGTRRSPTVHWAYVHDVLPLTHPEFWTPLQIAVKRSAFREIQRSGANVLTSSNHNADVVESALGRRPKVVKYGCGQLTDDEADAAYGWPATARDSSVVAIGTLQPRKGLPTLIQGFADAIPNLPGDTRLRIVGSGNLSYTQELKTLAAHLGVGSQVRFMGAMNRDDALDLMKHAGAIAFPSTAEGFGLPILEALALGTPVITSDLPEIRSWAGDTTAYVPPESVPHLSRALARILSGDHPPPDGGQEVARSYRWKTFAASLIELSGRG